MMTDLVVGLLATAVPALAVGYLMLNKQPPIFRMFIVMVLVGLGYLTATGAIEDIGAKVQGKAAPTPVAAPATSPEPAKAEPAATQAAPATAPEETKTEAAPATADPATTTAAPEATQPPASTQVDPYPGAPKPAQ